MCVCITRLASAAGSNRKIARPRLFRDREPSGPLAVTFSWGKSRARPAPDTPPPRPRLAPHPDPKSTRHRTGHVAQSGVDAALCRHGVGAGRKQLGDAPVRVIGTAPLSLRARPKQLDKHGTKQSTCISTKTALRLCGHVANVRSIESELRQAHRRPQAGTTRPHDNGIVGVIDDGVGLGSAGVGTGTPEQAAQQGTSLSPRSHGLGGRCQYADGKQACLASTV